jgi:hypothetical protein
VERAAHCHVEPPDAIDHIMAAFKCMTNYVITVWSFARGCGTNTCDLSDDTASDTSLDYSAMPKLQACDMQLHNFGDELFYQPSVQQLRFDA